MTRNLVNAVLILTVVMLLVLLGRYVRIGPTPSSVVVLRTSGMSCSACARFVGDLLHAEKGVSAAEVSLPGGWAAAGYDAALVTPQTLAGKLTKAGFHATVQQVMTPAQYRKATGHDISQQRARMGCCAQQEEKTKGCSGCCNMRR